MGNSGARFDAVMAAIDDANARDPHTVVADGRTVPAELLYGLRMSETLAILAPGAGELLRIAVRGQHIERWTTPRTRYPPGRAGYLNWRSALKDFHAHRLAGIMTAAGYSPDEGARVGALVRKERLRTDPEAQLLEDTACVVFLAHYLDPFMSRTDADEAKLSSILARTWHKMSPLGHAAAGALDLTPRVRDLLRRGLEALESRT